MPSRDPGAQATTDVASRHEPTISSRFRLTVVDGTERGATFEIDDAPALIGKSAACDHRIDDRRVSRRHCSLEVQGRRLRITDLGSTNGTIVDGITILDALLIGGETIRIGETALVVERIDEHVVVPRAVASAPNPFRVLGESPEMRRLYPLIARLATASVPVVIEGETGTGKEMVAEAIHEASARSAGPYVVFDCTTVPPQMVEAELFGHERGAFTGAVAERKGLFEQAHGGTLLIDEIGDLDLALQPKLLRAIERSEIRRLGGTRALHVDVRVLAATRRNLDLEVQEGRFRDDLYHRLAVARLELPPLRRRRGDIALLARHFWTELGADRPLPDALLARWESAAWPGNVRELRNAVARQVALGDLDELAGGAHRAPADPAAAGAVPNVIAELLTERLPYPLARVRLLDAFEKLYVERVLVEHDGNMARAASAAGVGRRYFQMLRYGRSR